MPQLNVVILAAGKGKRMLSKKPKIMHEIMGKPMIHYVVDRARELAPSRIIAVTGHEKELVEAYLTGTGVTFALQAEQKGTAHALLTAGSLLGAGDILVLYGDVPLIRAETLARFVKAFEVSEGILFMTTGVDDPSGYGRMILNEDEILRIVEDADTDDNQKRIREINTGICMLRRDLLRLTEQVKPDNNKDEYYLTDICEVARAEGIKAKAFHHPDAQEVLGINTRKDLLAANVAMRERIQDGHLKNGVTLLDRAAYIEAGVTIGRDTVIHPGCFLTGSTVIGEDVSIGPYVVIKDSNIGNNVTVDAFSTLDGVTAEEGVRIGPFSRIRPTTLLKQNVKVGNFVEVKNAVIDQDTKANHLSYIGDADIGREVNIGAGTITCNYDGRKKHRTTIGDGVFVGSNTELVAPVKIGKDAVIGAGSTITKDVPDGALAVTRAKQKHIEGYGRRKK